MRSRNSTVRRGDALITVVAITATAGALACVWKTMRRQKPRQQRRQPRWPYPPSPPGHWLLGHALLLEAPSKKSLDVTLYEWYQKYDHLGAIFSFRIPLLARFIVIGDPGAARYVLVRQNYDKHYNYNRFLTFLLGRQSMLVAGQADHKDKRKLFHAGFQPDFLQRSIGTTIIDFCKQFLMTLQKEGHDDKVVHMLDATRNFTSAVISQLAFGEDWSDPTHPARQSMEHMTTLLVQFTINPLAPLNPLIWWQLWKWSRILDREMKAVVQRCYAKVSPVNFAQGVNDNETILSLAITNLLEGKRCSNSNNNTSLSTQDLQLLADQVKTIYFGGHDTTSILLTWTTWLLGQNPQVSTKIRQELHQHIGDWTKATKESLQKCTYAEAVLKEVLRLYPPVGGARYTTDASAEYAGYRLDHAMLYICPYLMHRIAFDSKGSNDDSNQFRPERFFEPYESDAYVPFSKGAWDCIGKNLAMLEAKVALLGIVSEYHITTVDLEKERLVMKLTNQPLRGCQVKLRKLGNNVKE